MSSDVTGSSPARIQAWLKDLTFAEVHAFIWGFGLVAGGLTLHSTALLALAGGILIYAFTGRKALLRKLVKSSVDVPDYVFTQVRREVHYYIGGLLAGLGAGALARAFGLSIDILQYL
ncbi:hypothetical protein U3A55_11825 [Salarchaeum sp. III]|uniref:hypothetical protein n=1 Tax=Salarchaeum sp. III TaxID=3107927 RepID=UPI002ED9390E